MKKTSTKPVKAAVNPVAKRIPAKSTSTPVKKTPGRSVVKQTVKSDRKPEPPRAAGTPGVATAAAVESLRQEVTSLRTQLARVLSPVATGTIEEVDALRRVLSDLMEARMNDVIRELVVIRNTAASAGGEARRVTEQMDALLADLGALKFEAERLEYVDPLIHAVTREVTDASLPDGVIVETIRPGFHTGRGFVVAKALVAMNRRS